MSRLIRFFSSLDARRWRALAVSFLLFGGVGVLFLFGAPLLGLDGAEEIAHWMGAWPQPGGLFIAVGVFALLAFVGAPQFVLIAAAVVACGPTVGFVYSWAGTMVSAMIGFGLGRWWGESALRPVAGAKAVRFLEMIGRNGFMASLLVRLVPSAPFIIVNMAGGATPMRVRDFAAGTALGIVPKIALTAFSGEAVLQILHGRGGPWHWLALALAAAVWAALILAARAWTRRRETGA